MHILHLHTLHLHSFTSCILTSDIFTSCICTSYIHVYSLKARGIGHEKLFRCDLAARNELRSSNIEEKYGNSGANYIVLAESPFFLLGSRQPKLPKQTSKRNSKCENIKIQNVKTYQTLSNNVFTSENAPKQKTD